MAGLVAFSYLDLRETKMLRGSCLCGGVKYEISGGLSGVLNRRCSLCRKAHGAKRGRAQAAISTTGAWQ